MPPTPGKPAKSLCQHLISGCQRMLIVGFLLATLAQAQTFTTLYKFRGGRDGKDTFAGVIQDASGKLYGTTTGGGNRNCNMGEKGNGCGVVYRVNTDGTETVLVFSRQRHVAGVKSEISVLWSVVANPFEGLYPAILGMLARKLEMRG